MASQKAAMARPETVNTRSAWSSQEFRRAAARTPRGMPTTAESRMLTKASSSVAGNRATRSSAIGRCV